MATDPAVMMVPPWTPELLKEVQGFVELWFYINTDEGHGRQKVLELGSGWSTIWLSLLDCDVTSVEHAQDWHEEVCRVLRELHLPINQINAFPTRKLVEAFPDDWFDLILVDCIDEQRLECIYAARTRVRTGGMVLVDDSHWDILASVPELLKGWKSCKYDGMHKRKTGEVKFHESTLWFRP